MEKGSRLSPTAGESTILEIFSRIDPLRLVRRSARPTPLDEELAPLVTALRSSSLVDGTPIEEKLESLFKQHGAANEWMRSRSWPPLGLPEYMLEILGWCLKSGAFQRARKWENRILSAAKPGPRSMAILRAFIDESLLGELRRRVHEAMWSDAYEFGCRAKEYLGSLRPEGDLLLALSAVFNHELAEGERLVLPWRERFKRPEAPREPLYPLYRRVENAALFERGRIALHEERPRDAVKLFTEFRQGASPEDVASLRIPLGLHLSAALYSLGRYAQACAELRPVVNLILETPNDRHTAYPEIEPTAVLYTFCRGALMSGKSGFRGEALRAAEWCASRNGDDAPLVSTYGFLLLWEGRGREALKALLRIKAPRNSELSVEVTALKSYAYSSVGNPLRAKELYEEAWRRQPNHPIFKLLEKLFSYPTGSA